MELIFKVEEQEYTLNLNNNTILFGKDSVLKNKIINNLLDNLNNKKNNILIDGNKYDSEQYNIIYINEETDFTNEFKFTKNNPLKKLIYEDILSKKNSEKLINYTNEIFDTIDDKVNKMLNKNINKQSDNTLLFQIEIPDINSIIDKFTNIYIDNMLLNSNEITKSVKRKILYQLCFLTVKENIEKNNIIIIQNFDAYLNTNETIKLINDINKMSKNKCHFILTTTSNIFEYIPLENFSIYKVTNRLISLNIINEAIKRYILKNEYNYNINFEDFYNENEYLIIDEDINKIKDEIFNHYPHLLSKILNCNEITISLSKPKIINNEYIICNDNELKKLFTEIYNIFVD